MTTMNDGIYESMQIAYDNGELEEYLDDHENIFYITEKDCDGSYIYRGSIITISGCKINTMEYTITDIDEGTTTVMNEKITNAIDSYGEYIFKS